MTIECSSLFRQQQNMLNVCQMIAKISEIHLMIAKISELHSTD